MNRHLLLLDSSTDHCTAALVSEVAGVVAEREETDRAKQAERLAVMANEVLQELPDGQTLSGICVAEGPGSYTGLRIAAGYAKGLAWSRSLPLLTLPTTLLMTRSCMAQHAVTPDTLLMPMIDARRMEVYSALYDSNGEAETEISALILTDDEVQSSLRALAADRPLLYFGSGAEKAREMMTTLLPLSRYIPDIYPKAKDMAADAFARLDAGKAVDVAYWEPFYLKEYQAKKSLNKVLRQALEK
ncbi:MAG: tRNA (adenosine(37)-N6)-threonylcarbamoyltransferase complex dimerization subunit type 1 TsaB [Porphyromonas sp.]|nr:tRNA (adenosine(37)-N6)-threonylcarbamoyltransferase complex dimerization subunit type 1 TsaB [Porphyromonas sp.]